MLGFAQVNDEKRVFLFFYLSVFFLQNYGCLSNAIPKSHIGVKEILSRCTRAKKRNSRTVKISPMTGNCAVFSLWSGLATSCMQVTSEPKLHATPTN